jgi:hypothetical protein
LKPKLGVAGADSALESTLEQDNSTDVSTQSDPAAADSLNDSLSGLTVRADSRELFAASLSRERYFALKSVDAQELELSIKTGIWAT